MRNRKLSAYLLNARRHERVLGNIMRTVGFESFETREDAQGRNVAMRKRLAKHGSTGRARKLKKLANCSPFNICEDVSRCPAACHHASRAERARISARMYVRLKDTTEDIVLVTIVNDRWRKARGELHACNPKSLLKWFDRRLDRLNHLKNGLNGIVGVDVSINEVDGESFWQPHLHAVLTGLDSATLARIFKLKPTDATKKPVMMKRVDPRSLANAIGYAMKRTVEKRVGYLDKNGARNQRAVKVPSDAMIEHDLWLMDQRATERFRVIGMRLSREQLVCPVSFRSTLKWPRRPPEDLEDENDDRF